MFPEGSVLSPLLFSVCMKLSVFMILSTAYKYFKLFSSHSKSPLIRTKAAHHTFPSGVNYIHLKVSVPCIELIIILYLLTQ